MTTDAERARNLCRFLLEAGAADAYALEDAIGESEAFFDAFPDTYTFTGADSTEHTFESLTCTFASSSHGDDHVVECKTCAWRKRYGELPRDPCLMYVVPPLCPVCRAHGDVSGVRSRYPRTSSKPHAAPAADDDGLIPDGGEEADDAAEPDGLFSALGDDRPGVPAGEGETWGAAAERLRREEVRELRRVCREWAAERFGNADAGDAIAERIVEETDHFDPSALEALADTVEEGDCPADGCDGTLVFARRLPSVVEYDCTTCDTTVPYYPEGEGNA